MLQVVYTSRVVTPLTRAGYDLLLDQAQTRNGRDGITGLLLYDGARFVQAVEGPEELVASCMSRIVQDGRHCAVELVQRQPVLDREFGSFSMKALTSGAGDADAFVEDVKRQVSGVGAAHLQALFIGFAVLSRSRVPAGFGDGEPVAIGPAMLA